MKLFVICVFVLTGFVFSASGQTKAVTPPPLPVHTFIPTLVEQKLDFGTVAIVCGTNGGTVSIDPATGQRSAGGNVILVGLDGQAAEVQFHLCPGRLITVTYPDLVYLTGYLTSKTIKLCLTTDKGHVFMSNMGCEDIHVIKIGGTITLCDKLSNPADEYSGSFTFTLNSQ